MLGECALHLGSSGGKQRGFCWLLRSQLHTRLLANLALNAEKHMPQDNSHTRSSLVPRWHASIWYQMQDVSILACTSLRKVNACA